MVMFPPQVDPRADISPARKGGKQVVNTGRARRSVRPLDGSLRVETRVIAWCRWAGTGAPMASADLTAVVQAAREARSRAVEMRLISSELRAARRAQRPTYLNRADGSGRSASSGSASGFARDRRAPDRTHRGVRRSDDLFLAPPFAAVSCH